MRIFKDGSKAKDASKTGQIGYLKKAIETQQSIGKKIEYFLATGNLKT